METIYLFVVHVCKINRPWRNQSSENINMWTYLYQSKSRQIMKKKKTNQKKLIGAALEWGKIVKTSHKNQISVDRLYWNVISNNNNYKNQYTICFDNLYTIFSKCHIRKIVFACKWMRRFPIGARKEMYRIVDVNNKIKKGKRTKENGTHLGFKYEMFSKYNWLDYRKTEETKNNGKLNRWNGGKNQLFFLHIFHFTRWWRNCDL